MTDFTSEFWSVYVAVITVVSIVACAVFLKSQSVRRPVGIETTGHKWDEDLAEYNNPLPRWWSWLFYITIVFGLVYLVLYPGLGSWRGTLGWSQVAQLKEETAAAQKQFGPLYERFAAMEIEALAKNPEALPSGRSCSSTIARSATPRTVAARAASRTSPTWNGSGAVRRERSRPRSPRDARE